MLLRRRYALQHQYQRPPRRAYVDWFVAGIQHQYRLMKALHHNCPTPSKEIRRSVRATAATATWLAPARFKTLAQAPAVAPVVSTSSISSTRKPFKFAPLVIRNAPRTFSRRLELLRPAWGAVAFTRRTVFETGTPQRRETSLASNSDWLYPRLQRFFQ